jgi:hypothetical protein
MLPERLAAGVDDMGTRGRVYLVSARRADAGWIHYRTCDQREAATMARRLGSTVKVEGR